MENPSCVLKYASHLYSKLKSGKAVDTEIEERPTNSQLR